MITLSLAQTHALNPSEWLKLAIHTTQDIPYRMPNLPREEYWNPLYTSPQISATRKAVLNPQLSLDVSLENLKKQTI